jgi:hypothetical protein
MFRPVFRRIPALFPTPRAFALLLPLLGAAAHEAGAQTVVPGRGDTALMIVDSVPIAKRTAADSLDSVRLADPRRALRQPAPDSTWRWPANPRAAACSGPLETVMDCWRDSPRVALQQTGFPGIRAGALDLRSLEPARVHSFYQPGMRESQYRTGGQTPFASYEEGLNGDAAENWAPVQPLDTPLTDIHWTRGALFLNQFTFSLDRMVGNRAYLGFDYHSDGSESVFYEYPFNVHQPYLGGLGRDSASLVIQDTSHFIKVRQVRPRLGFWLNARTVLEVHGDFFLNRTSMVRPTNPATRDSLQSLYAASFSASAFGAILAHSTDAYIVSASAQHASWGRRLSPGGLPARESASGLVDRARVEWSAPKAWGLPRASLEVENTIHENTFRLSGADTSTPLSASARGDVERLRLEGRPDWGPVTLDLQGEGARRARADGVVEWLGGGDAEASLDLPLGFEAKATAGAHREGAPEDWLFRWAPALGLYPNAGLAPRDAWRYGASAGWKSRHLGFGAGWDRNLFHGNWLTRVLPSADPCSVDSTSYAGLSPEQVCPDFVSTPDSLALARVNYDREQRDLAHVSMYLALGNWKLSLLHTRLLDNSVRDARLGFEARNREIPADVTKGQLLWKRRVLDGKLGLRTQWDWEWFSERYVFASDLDGTARAIKLDEYLALDFMASMEIRSFLLYFRAMNLNHDRYAAEPGVHPPGINFRFGVDWRIRN